MTRNISRSFINSKAKLRHLVEKKEKCAPLYYKDKIEKDLLNLIQKEFIKVKKPKDGKYKLLEEEKGSEERKIEKDFYIGKYQVTQELYIKIMTGKSPSNFKGANLPVEQVSWYNAVSFCNRLSEKYNLGKYYEINDENVTINVEVKGFRLPTESEWVYAATSAGKYKEKTDYARNDKTNNLDDLGWYFQNSNGKTHPVGQKQANELGLYDMSGNVWEWCYDLYRVGGSRRVLCGGSWNDGALGCGVSFRGNDAPDFRDGLIGFRLVVPL